MSRVQVFKCLDGQEVTGVSVTAARIAANNLHTKLLYDATKQERDEYLHRFGELVR